jgi:UDP-sulfoquinovose synthase
MRILVCGGDGFCGWPTSLELASAGHEVTIIDNLSRRKIDIDIASHSLVPIANISERIREANLHVGKIHFVNIDLQRDADRLRRVISDVRPEAIIQFAEQRAAPFSMLSDTERRYTVDNNVSGTHNICSAIVDIDPTIHLIHLGTMGVYGYNKDFGPIPEGYLDITVGSTGVDTNILYPANPGSIYHLTKCLDQLIFQFYTKNWGMKITDLHQGIVWGTETHLTKLSPVLANRFDYDGIYGTVLNRFIVQAAMDHPLSVYGTGGQSRAFIHISDTAKCVKLAAENADFDNNKVRIFNQVSEVRSVIELAKIIESKYGAKIDYIDNPRKELAKNDLEVRNQGLKSLGFEPITLSEELINDVEKVAHSMKENFSVNNVNNSPKW